MDYASLKSWLMGRWALQRLVITPEDSAQFRMSGIVEFKPLGNDLAYAEQGEILSKNYHGDFYQTYIFKFIPNQIQVCFADGKPFHHLNFESDSCSVVHLCKNDNYAGIFKILNENTLQIHWKITGPRKSQEITSTLTKTQVI